LVAGIGLFLISIDASTTKYLRGNPGNK